MKIKNTKLSKRTLALLAATVLLFGGGSFTGTKAALTYFSNDYTAEFSLDHLQVHLIENGVDVCHGENDIYTVHRGDSNDGSMAEDATKNKKYKGNLVEYLGYTNDQHTEETPSYTLGTPGKVEPGRTYKEEISAKNGSNIDQYVRLTVKKYWVKTGDNTTSKDTTMDPKWIKLSYNGEDYNTDGWKENTQESTTESRTFYLLNVLKGGDGKEGGESSPLLFNELTIDGKVADLKCTETTKKESTPGGANVTVITYKYDYDGYTFFIEADVQAIQTHNANDAIGALWGVSNVSAKDGVVTVK